MYTRTRGRSSTRCPASPRAAGFTLIELMIVVTIIAVLASIAIPNLMSARLTTNETAAISNLRNIWTGEAQFQASAYADVDNDGSGEYGFLRELTGAAGVRTSADGASTGRVLTPSVISGAFRSIDANGAVGRTGYRFVLRLPAGDGSGVHETPSGAVSNDVDANLAETTFCIYAWPTGYASTGNRTFFINQQGNLAQSEDPSYNGDDFHTAMSDGMAFEGAGSGDSITGDAAQGTVGRDGNLWKSVN